MKPAEIEYSIASATDEFFPIWDVSIVELPAFEDVNQRVAAFVAAVNSAKHRTCLVVPSGTYPAINVRKNIIIRAEIPGTVRIVAEKNLPVVTSSAACVRLEGVLLQAAEEEGSNAVLVTSGRAILEDCTIAGSIASQGSGTNLYLRKCRIQSAKIGLNIAAGSRAFVETSAFARCGSGILVNEGASLEAHYTRFESCGKYRSASSGAAIRAIKAKVFCSGCRFTRNEKGVEMTECLEARFAACIFEGNLLGSIIAVGGSPLKLHTVQFFDRDVAGPEHLNLSHVEADTQFCKFENRAFLAGDEEVAKENMEIANDRFPGFLGVEETRIGLESIFKNAHTALQKAEHGLPIPLQSFHCVFEGKPFLGQEKAAAILANRLQEMGFLSTNKIVHVQMDDLLLHKQSVTEVSMEARGGVLMLYVSPLARTREVHAFYHSMREAVSNLLKMCRNHTVLILCGERDFVRPILMHSPDTEALEQQVVRFSLYSPAESAHMFFELCHAHEIQLTPRAMEKLLLAFYMLEDRKDKRFSTSDGVTSLFRESEKQHRQRCESERNYRLAMDEADLKFPLGKNIESLMSGQPAFASICPQCGSEFPWMAEIQNSTTHCPSCNCAWKPGWGIWKDSLFFQRLTKEKTTTQEGNKDLRYRSGPY